MNIVESALTWELRLVKAGDVNCGFNTRAAFVTRGITAFGTLCSRQNEVRMYMRICVSSLTMPAKIFSRCGIFSM
jgi:hypothetical protein